MGLNVKKTLLIILSAGMLLTSFPVTIYADPSQNLTAETNAENHTVTLTGKDPAQMSVSDIINELYWNVKPETRDVARYMTQVLTGEEEAYYYTSNMEAL